MRPKGSVSVFPSTGQRRRCRDAKHEKRSKRMKGCESSTIRSSKAGLGPEATFFRSQLKPGGPANSLRAPTLLSNSTLTGAANGKGDSGCSMGAEILKALLRLQDAIVFEQWAALLAKSSDRRAGRHLLLS